MPCDDKFLFSALTLDKREERKEKREEWWATHSHLIILV